MLRSNGKIEFLVGTSISSPVVCGMVACLWQALPEFTAFEIMDLIKRSASCASNPDMSRGYGIPNFEKALQMGRKQTVDNSIRDF